eukprot:CAMPEP_0205892360 /NCGR_PEP_ID=MMETSP1083-20121108/22630_1 /ASSEMBLY_ACC=CAM_ASM_000430 /TAXON_ID=97485 /ORGANISM="Prymnesium parvum, Strain Texoma1" /LENGTH=184 /DNA_ID=CAMNT_0053256863 /DNA_START=8 /DNA_END=563 /DNA_ORIENTATION=+
MTTDEPRVLCISVFDNGPVHLLDTIHRSAEMVTVYKARWDHLSQSKKKTPMRLLSIINDYNHNMNNVEGEIICPTNTTLTVGFGATENGGCQSSKNCSNPAIDEAALKAVGTLAAASVPKGTVIEPMPHLDFLVWSEHWRNSEVTNPPAMLQQVRGLEMLALRLRASLTAKKSTHSSAVRTQSG